ncbi:glycerophosphodiester phosphodiesterase family protein [Methylopila sp. M107]|uniref:glycerophosphodiester phosphodiesterase family protein n=1 Tax=Methylopila sp. M107 TaxID=1101190 RepID=UPI000382186B|nr:glycerophosphodiester phosphodiesterase family protein [Methylopila sp. M107]
MAGRLDWLTARPIAHRGLHDAGAGVVENTPAAVARAVKAGYGVEIDVRLSADGEAVVFHDATLDRLTEASGPVSALTVAELRRVAFRASSDRIFTLDECLDLVGGRQALVVEIKSGFDADMRIAARTADILNARGGPVVAESFDPRVLLELRRRAPKIPRGVVGEAFAADSSYWAGRLTRLQRFAARNLLHWPLTRPDFLSWDVNDLSRGSVRLARAIGVPVTSWTVLTPEDQARASLFADQIVFEGFRP